MVLDMYDYVQTYYAHTQIQKLDLSMTIIVIFWSIYSGNGSLLSIGRNLKKKSELGNEQRIKIV